MNSSERPVFKGSEKNYGDPLSYDPHFTGPVKLRSCTDIIFLFAFVSLLCGWFVVAYFAVRSGDPRVLLHSTDSDGNLCGIGQLQNKTALYYFDIRKCEQMYVLDKNCATPKVCVETCPNETYVIHPSVPGIEEKISRLICKYDVGKGYTKSVIDLLQDEDCAAIYIQSRAVLGVCIPEMFLSGQVPGGMNETMTNNSYTDNDKNKTRTEKEKIMENAFTAARYLLQSLSSQQLGEKIFQDFLSSWHLILIGLLISMLVSLIWAVLLRWIAAPLFYSAILVLLASCIFGMYQSVTKYLELNKGNAGGFKLALSMKNMCLALAVFSGLVFLIFLLLVIFLRKHMRYAIALIREASKCVGAMFTTLVFPVISYVLMMALFSMWIAIALYIASSGKASFIIADAPEDSGFKNGTICNPKLFRQTNASAEGAKCIFQNYGLKNNLYTAHIYNTIIILWTLVFLICLSQLTMAGAFGRYYWTLNKNNINNLVWVKSLYYSFRYHLGSVALGSLLRSTLFIVSDICKAINTLVHCSDNAITRIIFKCISCCSWIFDIIISVTSEYTFVMVAIHGESFLPSSKRFFFLVKRHFAGTVILNGVTSFLLFIGKLVVVSVAAVSSYYLFATKQTIYKGIPVLNFYLLPPIFITIGSYIVAKAFFSIYETAIDTLFLCFLEDCERNDGSERKPYFMSKELMKIFQNGNKYKEQGSIGPH